LAEAEAKYKAETKIQAEELSASASAFVSVFYLASARLNPPSLMQYK